MLPPYLFPISARADLGSFSLCQDPGGADFIMRGSICQYLFVGMVLCVDCCTMGLLLIKRV